MVDVIVKMNHDGSFLKRHILKPQELSFPRNWNELTPKQLLYIAQYWEAWQELVKMGESTRKARALLLLELCGLNTWWEKKILSYILSFYGEDAEVNLLGFVDFVFEKITLTKNKFPILVMRAVNQKPWNKHRKVEYLGPGDHLSGTCIEEFSFAFACYSHYMATRDESHLDNLIGVLYRPKLEDPEQHGYQRKPFNKDMVKFYAESAKALSSEIKHAVLLYFIGCMEYFMDSNRFGLIFRRAGKNERAGSFLDTVLEMAGGPFGTFNETKATDTYLFLKELKNTIKKAEKKKKKK